MRGTQKGESAEKQGFGGAERSYGKTSRFSEASNRKEVQSRVALKCRILFWDSREGLAGGWLSSHRAANEFEGKVPVTYEEL